MPSIDEIMQVAEALEKSPVIIVRDRCSAVRNRNASCRRCVQACPFDAIQVSANEISLNAHACVGCGACVPACPTEALVAIEQADEGLLEGALATMGSQAGEAVIACARISSKRTADPSRYVEVACLAGVSETLLIELAAKGVKSVALVDGNCRTCKHQACMSALELSSSYAQSLLRLHGSPISIERRTGFPEEMKVESGEGLHGSTRRGFFSEAAQAAKDTAMIAAKTTLESELGHKAGDVSIGERLRVTSAGTLPLLEMPRHEAAINALDSMGQPSEGIVESRLFGTVDIDGGRCNACGMCAVFCPTGALVRYPAENAGAPPECIEFSAADCVQCGLCVDVCWKNALTMSDAVDVAELYDFEPRVFKMPGKTSKRTRF